MQHTKKHFILLAATIPLLLVSFVLNAKEIGKLQNTVFRSGEVITYNAYYNWGFLWFNAGEVVFSVENAKYENKPCYHIKSLGRTHSKYDNFFMVRDTFEVFVQPDSLSTYFYRRATYEGPNNMQVHYRANFDSMKIHAQKTEPDQPLRSESYDILKDSYNVLTAIYAVRNFDFKKVKVDETIPFKLWVDMDYADVYVRYKGITDVKLKDGSEYNCLVFSPLLVEGTLFRDGEGMKVYVTNDKNRIPVMIEAKILVGSVKAILSNTKGLRYPVEARLK